LLRKLEVFALTKEPYGLDGTGAEAGLDAGAAIRALAPALSVTVMLAVAMPPRAGER
jgi:hypothetical protein